MYCWFILKCEVFVETQHLNDSGFSDIFINCNQVMKNATMKVTVPGTKKIRQIPAQFSLHRSMRNQYVKVLWTLRQAWKIFLFAYSQAHHNWCYTPIKLNSKGNVLENYFICVDIPVIFRWCWRKVPFAWPQSDMEVCISQLPLWRQSRLPSACHSSLSLGSRQELRIA